MFYTYMHTRNDTGQPFYIGKGRKGRINLSKGRSSHWNKIVSKHGMTPHILAEWKTETEAFEHEKFLIKCFKDIGTPICNMTDGGEGCSGRKMSESTKVALMAVNKNRIISVATREKISKSLTGRKGHNRSVSLEIREKISQTLIGRKLKPFSDKHKQNIASSAKVRAEREAKSVLCIETGIEFSSAMAAQIWLRANGSPKAVRVSILNVCNGVRMYRTAYGYRWKFSSN